MLTGQCKNDFGDQCKYDYKGFCQLDEIFKQALIAEWFDSVGIYISVEVAFDTMCKYVRGFYVNVITDTIHELWFDGDVFETRQEATKAAIEKANDLYNDKFK